MSYKGRIQDIIGDVGDDNLITQPLQDAGAKIIDISPLEKLKNVARTTSISSSGLDVSSFRVLGVSKSSYIAKLVPNEDIAKYKDSNSIHYAVDTEPIYHFIGEKVFITSSGAATTGDCMYVPKIPTTDGSTLVLHSDSAVVNVPLEAESLMVLGASIICLQRRITDRLDTLKQYLVTDEYVELASTQNIEIQGYQGLLATVKAEYQQQLEVYIN